MISRIVPSAFASFSLDGSLIASVCSVSSLSASFLIFSQASAAYAQMDAALSSAYREAAEENGALLVPVGAAFTRARSKYPLYQKDHFHPSPYGTYLAAWVFAEALAKGQADDSWRPEGMDEKDAKMIQSIAKETEDSRP